MATASLAGVTSNAATRTVASTVFNGRVSGAKYYDGSRNGVRDAADAGIGAWRINVFSGTKLVKTFATAPDGTFSIALAPGTYTLREAAAQSAWTQTGNTAAQFSAGGGMTVTLSGGAYGISIPSTGMSDAAGLNFGNACAIVPVASARASGAAGTGPA